MVLTKLAEVMAVQEITTEELAAKAMLSARSILNAKRGRGVSLNTGKRIAKTLKVDLKKELL